MCLGINDHLCECRIWRHMLTNELLNKSPVNSENITQEGHSCGRRISAIGR